MAGTALLVRINSLLAPILHLAPRRVSPACRPRVRPME